MLSFQRLDVYRVAIEFLALAVEVAANVPRGYAHLADQLRRAATSSPLNIAEAAGRASDADAARHYAIARGAVDQRRYANGIELLERERGGVSR